MKHAPLVSVIIPTINRNSLAPAINSVAAQTYGNIEIIVIDDCSTTPVNQAQLLDAAAHRPVRVLRNSSRLGGAAARNAGIDHALGEYIAFLDDDDIYFNCKIDSLLEAIITKECDAAFGKIVLHGNGTAWSFTYPPTITPMKNFYLFNIIHNNATLIHRDALKRVRFLPSLVRFQDTQFNTELFLRTKVTFVDEFVAAWDISERTDRITSQGDTNKRINDANAFQELIDYYLILFGDEVKQPLAAYHLKLCKMFLDAGKPTQAFQTFLKAVLPIHNIPHIKNTMTMLRHYREKSAVPPVHLSTLRIESS